MTRVCAECGSNNLVKASAAYDAGTFTGTTSGSVLTMGGGPGITAGAVHLSSQLAKRLAPPEEPSMLVPIGMFAIALAFVVAAVGFGGNAYLSDGNDSTAIPIATIFLVPALIIGMCGYFCWLGTKVSRKEHASDMNNWNQLWYCPSCDRKIQFADARA
jgi:Na+/proline symporter